VDPVSVDVHDRSNASGARMVYLRIEDHASPPYPDGTSTTLPDLAQSTEPDVVTSPLRADGLGPCTGIMWMLQPPPTGYTAAQPVDPAGFAVTVYLQDPVSRRWGRAGQVTAAYGVWYRTFDCNGGPLYWLIEGWADPPSLSTLLLFVVEI
jgi:hypothetical protein